MANLGGERPVRVLYVSMLCERGTREDTICTQATRGGVNDPDWFASRAGAAAVVTPVFITHGDGLPASPADTFDAVVVGGTFNSASDDKVWLHDLHKWLRNLWGGCGDGMTADGATVKEADGVARRTLPLLGICGGHQAVSVVLGSGTASVTPMETGPTDGTYPIELTAAGSTHPLFRGFDQTPRFHFGNYDHINETPTAAETLARTPTSPAVACDWGRGWWSTQFHPEAPSSWFSELVTAGLIECQAPQGVYTAAGDEAGERLIANWLAAVSAVQ
eukprot:m.21234 g.21234  ORF g.21234 m.21234 type:complete len:276 (+) comp5672_c0_seq1:30-857(+)